MKEPVNETVSTSDEESERTSSVSKEDKASAPLPITSRDPCFRYAKRFLILTGKVMGVASVVIAPLILIIVAIRNGTMTVDPSVASSSSSSESSIARPTTKQPSMAPLLPTPQPSFMPTWEPVVSPSFQMRLYWEDGYYWQESSREMFYCMECADCEEYSTGDGWEGDCRSPGSSTARCREGHLVWIEWCSRARGYTFEIIQHYESGIQIRVHGTNLCFSTVHSRYLELRKCNPDDALQLWSPIPDTNKFELRPYDQRDWSREDAVCLSQQHHPKSEELVGLHSCAEARRDETVYWSEYSS